MAQMSDIATNIALKPLPSNPRSEKESLGRSPLPGAEFWVQSVRDIDALVSLQTAWDDLAANSIERNPFYESWTLIDGVRHFGSTSDLKIDLVWQRNPRPNQPPSLVGLFPLERKKSFGRFPIRVRKVWHHEYLFYCAPLVRRGVASQVLHALFDEMSDGKQRASALELHHVDPAGPFSQALLDVTNERVASTFTVESYNRALFLPADSYDDYIATAMTNHNRQEIRRQKRRLSEIGKLETLTLTRESNLEVWINHFLQLESTGWKGREATALACDVGSRAYFESIASAAHARGQLMMVGLFLDQRPIALKCNFLAGKGSYAFKIASDESYAKYSPGVQLELENLRVLHQMPGTRWMDSCATRQHFMIGRLWQDRRTMTKTLVSTGRLLDNIAIDVLADLSSIRKALRRRPNRTVKTKTQNPGTRHE